MSKTEVYSWRLEPRLKSGLEEAARRRNESLSSLLGQIAQQWLSHSSGLDGEEDRAQQQRMREAASRTFGSLAGGDPGRAEGARQQIQEKLRKQHGR